ncbi:hypothetical protein C2S52_012812, partial [Perilla frutescens var. hirtella]
YVAVQVFLGASEIDMLIIKKFQPVNNSLILPKESGVLDPYQNELHLLDEQQTLAEISATFTQQYLVRLVPYLIREALQFSDSPIE